MSRNKELEPAIVIEVSSLEDLARLAYSMASRFLIMPIYRFKEEGVVYYFIQASFKDYYKNYGIPVVYYYARPATEDVDDSIAKYILAKADETGEHILITNKTRHGYTVIPIINLKSKPPFFKF